ncbi:MAG: peptidoglycan editing factor PgeF [Candidatus Moraniibacteriota bacterium]
MKFFLKDSKNIVAIISEKKDGSMKLSGSLSAGKNRDIFLAKNEINANNIVSARMIHGSAVGVVDKKSPRVIEGVDSLVTREKIFLAITVADCVPVYFYDKKSSIIGLAHAGWRGVTGGVIENTMQALIGLGGSSRDILVTLGPGIKACHFEIKADILDCFKRYPDFIFKRNDKIFVDLFGIIQTQLLVSGINSNNISVVDECTFEKCDKYFSYRRDKPKEVEVMLAVIGLK